MGVPAGPGRGRLIGGGPLEGRVVANWAGVPGGAQRQSPVVGITAPVGLGGHVEAKRLGGPLPRHPEVMRRAGGRPIDPDGQRRLAVVTVGGGAAGRAARVGQGGIQTLRAHRGGWTGGDSGPGKCGDGGRRRGRSGAGSGSGEGGGGGGRWSSAGSTRESPVTQRDAVEALT